MSRAGHIERREFCRFAAICTLAVCAGGLGGCARLVERAADGRSPLAPPGSPRGEIAVPADDATGAAPEPPAPTGRPDLAVFRGDDPAAAVRAAVDELGGMSGIVSRGARVVVKPNMLTARRPEYAATTNPAVVAALVTLAYEAGADDVVVFDRPTSAPRNVYEVSGIAEAVQSAGGRMKVLTGRDYERMDIEGGRSLTSWEFVRDVFEADVFINVPIAKTHGLAGLTLSMKNLMGVMGGMRGLIHQGFHQKIVDVAKLIKPHLVVLDAYRMLTANGPTGGNLRDVRTAKTVVAGVDMASVDAYGATLFGMRPDDLTYLRLAGEQGIGRTDLDAVRIVEGRV